MSTVYGSPAYGRGPYGGRSSIYTPTGATVQVVDITGATKGWYQLGLGPFLGLTFTVDEAGSRDFNLYFTTYVPLVKGDRVIIYVFDADDPFFTGVVRAVPIQGSTSQEYVYAGYGYNDYLERINTEAQTYTGQTIAYIVNDLLDNRLVPNSPIVKNAGKLLAPTTVVTEITLNYQSCKQALEDLQKIANADGNDYLVGVDEWGQFFFKPRDTQVITTLVVGSFGRNGIQGYGPQDSNEAKSRLYVLKSDGTYFGTYSTTDGTIDVNQIKLAAPQIDDADIDNWAEGQLAILERETRTATVNWQIETQAPTKLLGDGHVRIICNRPPTVKDVAGSAFGSGAFGSGYFGGGLIYSGYTLDDTLRVKQVEYSINDREAMRTIQLGSVAVALDRDMIEINKNIEALRISSGR